MTPFDRVIIADWSASATPSPARPSENAIWIGTHGGGGGQTAYYRTRAEAEAALLKTMQESNGRTLIGFDFPMGYPVGFAARLTGRAHARAVWEWLAAHLQDGPKNRNNRFQIANQINARFGTGPFWGRPGTLHLPHLPEKKDVDYPLLGLSERRQVETEVPRAQPVWKLYTTGAAGSQGLMGQPMIHRLSQHPGVAVWPFDLPDAPVVLAEVYPSLLAPAVAADAASIKDEAQVRLLSRALYALSQRGQLKPLFATHGPPITTEEGWILGAGHEAALAGALT